MFGRLRWSWRMQRKSGLMQGHSGVPPSVRDTRWYGMLSRFTLCHRYSLNCIDTDSCLLLPCIFGFSCSPPLLCPFLQAVPDDCSALVKRTSYEAVPNASKDSEGDDNECLGDPAWPTSLKDIVLKQLLDIDTKFFALCFEVRLVSVDSFSCLLCY